MREMTIISEGTQASVGWGTGKVSAGFLGEVGEVGCFDRLLAGGVVGVEGSAGDDVIGMFSAGGTCFVHVVEDCVDGLSVPVSPCLNALETEDMAAFDEESVRRLRPVVADSANQSGGVGVVGCVGIRCAGGGGGPMAGCRESRAGRRGRSRGRGPSVWAGMLEETVAAAEASPGGVVVTAGDPGQGLAVATGRGGSLCCCGVVG